MVIKNYYVYRSQFPLILAYAVTIHKCQGLSLDCAIIDLSDKVFADGMAYVALSRVRSLRGVHLIAFDPKSIRVNAKCLAEINRLRKLYRTDLPLYAIPAKSNSKKRKLTGTCESHQPPLKKPRVNHKRGCSNSGNPPPKKACAPVANNSVQLRSCIKCFLSIST